MSNNFDDFPLYTPIIKEGTPYLSEVWVQAFATMYMNLISYLTEVGILPPQLNQDEINNLKNLQRGQMLYNTTADTMQYYKASSNTWISF